MQSFYEAARDYYLSTGMNYKEASHHAATDREYWRCVILGLPIPEPKPYTGEQT